MAQALEPVLPDGVNMEQAVERLFWRRHDKPGESMASSIDFVVKNLTPTASAVNFVLA